MTEKKHLDAFEIMRYIQKRMKVCGCPRNAISCDTPERVIMMARLVLEWQYKEPPWDAQGQTEELYFEKAGSRWFGYLKRV